MPRTLDEILAQANELAARFEAYEPKASDELDAGAACVSRASHPA